MQRLSIIDAGLASAYEDEPLGDGTQRFRSRFHLVDATTGRPSPARPPISSAADTDRGATSSSVSNRYAGMNSDIAFATNVLDLFSSRAVE
jgi:hypothetical protein